MLRFPPTTVHRRYDLLHVVNKGIIANALIEEHGALFNGPLRGGLGAVQDEVRHGAVFQIRRPLNEQLLFLGEACAEAVRFG